MADEKYIYTHISSSYETKFCVFQETVNASVFVCIHFTLEAAGYIYFFFAIMHGASFVCVVFLRLKIPCLSKSIFEICKCRCLSKA